MKRLWPWAACLCCWALLAAPAWAGPREEVAAAVAARDRHDYSTANRILGQLLRRGGLPKEALSEVHVMRGVFWEEQHEYYRAIADFSTAIELTPDKGEAHNNLAWLLATCDDPVFQNPALALEHAQRAAKLLGESPDSLDTLAAAQAANQQYDLAVATAQRVVEATRKLGDAARLAQASQHLAAYQQGRPWREAPAKP